MRVKKVRMTLKLKGGVEVRTLEELRSYFDVEKILAYFKAGMLLKWLDTWHYTDEADKVRALDENEDNLEELCKIFNVEYSSPEEIEWRTERLNRLKKFTSDPEILSQVDNVAFDNDDLLDILEEENISDIYLCGSKFTFSSGMLKFENKNYYGVGNVTVKIESNQPVDLDELGLYFENVKFEGNIFEITTPTATYQPHRMESTNQRPIDIDDDDADFDDDQTVSQKLESPKDTLIANKNNDVMPAEKNSDEKAEVNAVIVNRHGIYASLASVFAQTASKFKSKIQLTTRGRTIDAKSTVKILGLGMSKGTKVTITAQGSDAVQAVNHLKWLIEEKFGRE